MKEMTARVSEKREGAEAKKKEEEKEGEAKRESDNGVDRARRGEYRAMEVVQTRSSSIGQAN